MDIPMCIMCCNSLDNGYKTIVVRKKEIQGLMAKYNINNKVKLEINEKIEKIKIHELCVPEWPQFQDLSTEIDKKYPILPWTLLAVEPLEEDQDNSCSDEEDAYDDRAFNLVRTYMMENMEYTWTSTQLLKTQTFLNMSEKRLKRKLMRQFGNSLGVIDIKDDENNVESYVFYFKEVAELNMRDSIDRFEKIQKKIYENQSLDDEMSKIRNDVLSKCTGCPELTDNFEHEIPSSLSEFLDSALAAADEEIEDLSVKKREIAHTMIKSFFRPYYYRDSAINEIDKPGTSNSGKTL
uniref:Uncharacterized protein n=1 Tax=Bracon brevicornis TaxID=1563983 RepID=A0A6V7LPD1_9HYME